MLKSLKPSDPITVGVVGEMMAALHIHANAKALALLHDKVVIQGMRTPVEHTAFIVSLLAVCGTDFDTLSVRCW